MSNNYTTYILRSELDGSYYYGHSKELKTRLKRHNDCKVRSTKAKAPWQVQYAEIFDTKSEAYRRELFFKSYDGYKFLKSKGII